MSTLVVAKKEFQDAIRSRTLLVVAALFTAFLSFYTYFSITIVTPGTPFEVGSLYLPVASVVVVIGTLLGYNAIVSERVSGSMLFLLGQPHTRRDVVIGKFLGRATVVTATVLIAFATVVPHFAVLAESPSFTAYAILVGKLLAIGVVFLGIAIAFSAALRSQTVATWGAIGIAVLFAFVWDTVLIITRISLFPPNSPVPNWFHLLQRIDPKYAFIDAQAVELSTDSAPFYLDTWFAVVILGFWLLVPLGLASLRFGRGDLA